MAQAAKPQAAKPQATRRAPLPEVRNLQFELAQVPRDWHGGRPAVTAFFDNLSVFFPAGEAFFVASVRAYRDEIDDARLKEEVRAFCAQEGHHTREHVRYNRRVAEHGQPVAAMEAEVVGLLGWVKRRVPKRLQLSATCALEHLTAILAHALLGDPEVLAGADATMSRLWRWHAAEENEHKAVAFDVFAAVGGTYWERVVGMVGASVIFWAKVGEQQLRMMRAAGVAGDRDAWRDLLGFLFWRPGTLRRMVPAYLAYFRPGFHPWQLDSRALLVKWQEDEAAWARAAKAVAA